MKFYENITIFTRYNIDGAGCYMVLKWLFEGTSKSINLIQSTEKKFREQYINWTKTVDVAEQTVIIADLAVEEENRDILDTGSNIIIFSHNAKLTTWSHLYTKSTVIAEKTPSCTSLVYRKLKDRSTRTLTTPEKYLILLIDDYDSYQLQLPESQGLNVVYESLLYNRAFNFRALYEKGFTPFNKQQQLLIAGHHRMVDDIIKELKIYTRIVPLCGKEYRIRACEAQYGVNEVASYLIKNCKADIAIVSNTRTGFASFRRSAECDCDLEELAKTLCEGSGRNDIAFGPLTIMLLEFLQTFTVYDRTI